MEAEATAAALQAKRDFDPTRGVPWEAFLRLRIIHSALARHRREWMFAIRRVPITAWNECAMIEGGSLPSREATHELLQDVWDGSRPRTPGSSRTSSGRGRPRRDSGRPWGSASRRSTAQAVDPQNAETSGRNDCKGQRSMPMKCVSLLRAFHRNCDWSASDNAAHDSGGRRRSRRGSSSCRARPAPTVFDALEPREARRRGKSVKLPW